MMARTMKSMKVCKKHRKVSVAAIVLLTNRSCHLATGQSPQRRALNLDQKNHGKVRVAVIFPRLNHLSSSNFCDTRISVSSVTLSLLNCGSCILSCYSTRRLLNNIGGDQGGKNFCLLIKPRLFSGITHNQTLDYKYREPAKSVCRQLCAVATVLQTIVRGI